MARTIGRRVGFLLALVVTAGAQAASAQDVVVETVVLDPQTTDPEVVVVVDPQQQQQEPEGLPVPQDDDDEVRAVATIGFWGSGMRPRELSFKLDQPEIQALHGVRIPADAIPTRSNSGGIAFGVGMRPVPWLRIPEIRFAFGAGGMDAIWTTTPEQPELEVAFRRLWQLRIEAVAGVEYDFKRITPFLRGWAALAIYGGRVNVRHNDLGQLGSERLGDVRGELGIEAGMNVRLGGPVGLMLAYRRGLVGATGHGAMIGFSILGD